MRNSHYKACKLVHSEQDGLFTWFTNVLSVFCPLLLCPLSLEKVHYWSVS